MRRAFFTLFSVVIVTALFLLASCGSFKHRGTDPCFYSDKCLAIAIEREAKAQKDYSR